MSSKRILKISSIIAYFEDDRKTVLRGENAVDSGHVAKMEFNADLFVLRGDVYASMKNKIYKVEVFFNDNMDVTDGKCTCPKGIKCHHIAGLLFFGHYNISVTDQTCKWNAPKPKATDKVKTLDEMYPAKPYKAADRDLVSEEINSLKLKLLGSTVGFSWLLKDEPSQNLLNLIPAVEDVVFSDDFFSSLNKIKYLKSKLVLSAERIEEVANKTIGQADNEQWLLARKHRITASNFGAILSACKRNRYPPSLFKRLFGVYNLDAVKAVQWGRNNEKTAIEEFVAATSLEVTSTGLWLHPCGFLGGSPDGLVGDNGIIEVKCPFSYRDEMLNEKLKTEKKYIITYDDNNEIVLNKDHQYYDQMQGLMHILNKSICYLVIWTLKETVIVPVKRNEEWAENINILQNFYYNNYINALSENKDI